MDRGWWMKHIHEVRDTFSGELATTSGQVRDFGLEPMGTYGVGFHPHGNSGAGLVAISHMAGAARVIMLGYDCQKTDGKAHWHGDHPRGLGNAGAVAKWPAQFAKLAETVKGMEVINCTRTTALDCFPRMDLDKALRRT
jgi:hypothetical protein